MNVIAVAVIISHLHLLYTRRGAEGSLHISIMPSPQTPHHPIPHVIPVTATWVGLYTGPGSSPSLGTRVAHHYRLFQLPLSPLHQGADVAIQAIVKSTFHSTPADPPTFHTVAAHIHGTILTILDKGCTDPGLVTLILVNDCPRNIVDVVALDVPNVPQIVSYPHQPPPTTSARKHAARLLTSTISDINNGEHICRGTLCGFDATHTPSQHTTLLS